MCSVPSSRGSEVTELFANQRKRRSVRLPSCEGSGPEMLLLESHRYCSVEVVPSSEGMAPSRRFSCSERESSAGIPPSCVGMLPSRELACSLSSWLGVGVAVGVGVGVG